MNCVCNDDGVDYKYEDNFENKTKHNDNVVDDEQSPEILGVEKVLVARESAPPVIM